jgi:uncharacterized protein YkwD
MVPRRPIRLLVLLALMLACIGAGADAGASASPVRSASPARSASYHRSARRHHSSCPRSASYHAGHLRSRRHRRARCHTHKRRHSRHHKHHAKRHVKHHVRRHVKRHVKHSTRRSASADVPCADTGLTPSDANIAQIRAAMLCLVNHEREAHGESALVVSAALEQAAQRHTESMAFGGYFDHVGPGGDTPLARMRAAGYVGGSASAYEVGENLAWGTLWLGSPRAIFAGWMASPGHRANILDAHFRDTAIGVSPHVPSSLGHGQAGGIYTQDFGVVVHG